MWPMRILMVNSLFHPNVAGGAEVAVWRLARELSARGDQVHVLAGTGRHAGERGLAVRRLPEISGEILEAPSAGRLDVLAAPGRERASLVMRGLHHFGQVHDGAWRRLAGEALDRVRPDVVHTHSLVGLTGAVWAACRARGVPVAHTLHDLHLLCPRTTLQRSDGSACPGGPLPCQVLRGLNRRQVRGVGIVTGPSRYVLTRHRGFGFFAGVPDEVVPNAIAEIPPQIPERSSRPIAGGVFVGRLNRQKGIPELLAALDALYDAQPSLPLTFAFAGDGPLRGDVEAFCARRPARARCFGQVEPEVRDAIFHQSDFTVLPAVTGETFGLTIVEGFAWGLPAIGSDRGGIPEVIRHDDDGLVVPPAAVPLAEAIARYALDGDLRRRHGAAARDRALDFTVQGQTSRFQALYQRISADHRLPA